MGLLDPPKGVIWDPPFGPPWGPMAFWSLFWGKKGPIYRHFAWKWPPKGVKKDPPRGQMHGGGTVFSGGPNWKNRVPRPVLGFFASGHPIPTRPYSSSLSPLFGRKSGLSGYPNPKQGSKRPKRGVVKTPQERLAIFFYFLLKSGFGQFNSSFGKFFNFFYFFWKIYQFFLFFS